MNIDTLWQDIRYVLRRIRQSPGFTSMVVITMALGIGANGAIFAVLDPLLIRNPDGVTDPRHVHRLIEHYVRREGHVASTRDWFSNAEIRELRAVAAGVRLAGYGVQPVVVDSSGDAANANHITGDYFGILGVRPLLGRLFTVDEASPEADAPVVVISQRMWITRFGGAAGVLGRSVDIDGRRFTIIGIVPPAFSGTDVEPIDVWAPYNATSSGWRSRDPQGYEKGASFNVLIRISATERASRLEAIATTVLRRGYSTAQSDSLATASLAPITAHADLAGDAQEISITTRLAGVSAIVLLIACANIANLLLARGLQRRREIAVRIALGVTRWRLVRQLLAESVVLALIGGAIAALIAFYGGSALREVLLRNVHWNDVAVGWRPAVFAAVLALVAGLLAGLIPALQVSRPDVAGALKAGSREGTFRRSRLRSALLILQTALSIALLAGAGLFIRSLRNVEGVDLGYDVDRLLFAESPYDPKHPVPPDELERGLADVEGRVATLPGVERAALMEGRPMPESYGFFRLFSARGDTLTLGGPGNWPSSTVVSPEFFATMGMRVVAGRGFSADDRVGSEPVALVNAKMAKDVWPGDTPIGKCIVLMKATNPCRTVVGVVSEAHFFTVLEEPYPRFYVPVAQTAIEWPGYPSANTMVLRVAPDRVKNVAMELRAALASRFGSEVRFHVQTMWDLMARDLRPWRLGAALFTAAGLLALIVAAVGIYSSISYTVSQRRHEMGVRAALGARAPAIVRLVVGQGVRVVIVGVVAGVGITIALGRLVASLLYGLSPRDPVVLVAVSFILVGTAVVACLVPAWRSTRVDPIEALRAD